jgi:ectoine hydroxylase-related dioxygenase (phytanoyl-CoA dioxygenase family)
MRQNMLTEADLDAHVARIARDGYTIVENAIEPELLDALATDLLRLEHDTGAAPARNIFEGLHTVRLYNLLARGAVYQRIPVHDHVLPIIERVLDRGCLVSSLSSIAIGPGETPQPLHADDQLIPLPRPHLPIIANSMWAITDFTEANGATRVVPGSHLRDHPPALGMPYDTVPAVMKRGSVLVYDGGMWHGGGANQTGERRVGIAMNYCAGWIRQQENQQLGIPLEIARGFSPRLRKLAGFGLYKKVLGHIDKCSPEDLLDGTPPRPVVGEF